MTLKNLLKTIRTNGSRALVEVFGGWLTNGANCYTPITLAYSAAPVMDASLGDHFIMTITDNVAFVIGAPINPPPTGFAQTLYLTIRNGSGGAHGAGTYDPVFKTSGNVPAIANGFSRTFAYQWNGTNWVQTLVPTTDVAN
jgi:hypothetical protein